MATIYALVAFAALWHPMLVAVIIGYWIINVAYTFHLKHQPVIDIFTVAIGFVLRVYAGAVAINVHFSSWIFVTTLALALYLAAIKRRQELISSSDKSRKVLQHYTLPLVDKYAEMSATCAIIFYSLYVFSEKSTMIYTIPLVLFGLYRYWYLVEVQTAGESPTDTLYTDRVLQGAIVTWIALWLASFSHLGGL